MKHFLISLLLLLTLTLPVHSQQYRVPKPTANVLRSLRAVDVREFLSHSKNIREWRRNIAVIERFNGGKRPGYFQREIFDSNFFRELVLSWDSDLQREAING